MAQATQTLRELHSILTQLAELRGRLERGPRQIRAREGAVVQLQTALEAAKELVKQARLSADRKQLDLETSEQRIAGWRVNLNACSSNKEYQTLTEQIAAAEMAGSVLGDEILETLERIDDLSARVAEAEQHLATGRRELEKTTTEVESAADGLRQEIARLEAELSTVQKRLPGDFKAEYARIVGARGDEGLAASEEGVCTGCGQQITANQQNNLSLEKPVLCGGCGCMLYLGD
ncbi:Putative zinc ribbon domain protein [Pirellulimonas nuda]|uniref:Zinc ribbon domain protein n=1 Tax=Pirellulimonas nuda TaxID=2528009 RepID=A0A518DF91_9BACT|nr:phospholipase [Pirellulimonas nuda]QDU90154.1 Putative zinc ribbon domain protein [Pirellulimonas nuda]